MSAPYRFAVCNEIFKDYSFAESCAQIRQIGYSGIEIAPFTLAGDPIALSPDDRVQIRQTIKQNNLEFVGLHWLLVSPAGLHATSPDKSLRRQTWSFIEGLLDLCADLRDASEQRAGVLVFGSPKQRSSSAGASPTEAAAVLTEELARIAPLAQDRGVALLLEPLSTEQTDVINTLDEAVEIVRQIASPAIQTMFDVHNAVGERLPHPELVRKYMPYIKHVHVNELDGREPGTGSYDFAALLSALTSEKYSGWVSLEVFDFSRDGREVASRALETLTQATPSQVLSQTL